MRYIIVFLIATGLLTAAEFNSLTEYLGIEIEEGSYAEGSELLDNPCSSRYAATPEPLDHATLADINDPTSDREYQIPVEGAVSYRDEAAHVPDEFDWGNDRIVYLGPGWPNSVGFDIDENTGDLYAVVGLDRYSKDSLIVYRSHDHGETWNFFCSGYNNEQIYGSGIRVVEDANEETWVIIMGIWNESSGRQLWTRRCTTSGGYVTWEMVADDVWYADMDADVGSSNDTEPRAYITYYPFTENIREVWFTGNALDGNGWQDQTCIFWDTETHPMPAIAAGDGGTVAITFFDRRLTSSQQLRIKRSLNYGSSWLNSQQVTDVDYNLRDQDIALSHGSVSQTGWITYSGWTDNCYKLAFNYSTNNGANWTYGGYFPSSYGHDRRSSLRANKVIGAVTLAYISSCGFSGSSPDFVMFSWTLSYFPSSFRTPTMINDTESVPYFTPAAGWTGMYSSAVLFGSFYGHVLFDWFSN